MTEGLWLPLFPLELVLLPGAILPLHIFEPRYRAMIARCLAGNRRFGILLAREAKLAPVGCEAEIVRVLHRYEDGRLDLLAEGGRRLALLEAREHADGYLEGRVAELADETEAPEADAARALRQLLREYRQLVEEEEARDADPSRFAAPERAADSGASGYTFAVAAAVQMGLDERQALLEERSERRREQFLLRHLARLIPQMRAGNENRRIIRGNGKPRPSA
jgi:ATP-dependent Lon protease